MALIVPAQAQADSFPSKAGNFVSDNIQYFVAGLVAAILLLLLVISITQRRSKETKKKKKEPDAAAPPRGFGLAARPRRQADRTDSAHRRTVRTRRPPGVLHPAGAAAGRLASR